MDLVVDIACDALGIGLRLFIAAADEHLVVGGVGDRPEAAAHAVARDHVARDARGALDVVRRAGRDIVQLQLLRDAPTQEGDNRLIHLVAGKIARIVGREADGHAARRTARDNGDLMHGVLRRQMVHGDGVARLMIGGQLPFMLRNDTAALFRPGNDLDHCILHVLHGDGAAVALRRQQCAFVHQILKISAGEAGRRLGNGRKIDIVCQRLVLGVDFENVLAAAPVGRADVDLPVEAARAQQRRIENVLAVGRGHDDDALVFAEAVHLDEQLVERLLTLIVTATETCAALTADGVDLVDEHDARRDALGLLEQVAHAARADADIQLNEIGAGDRQERNACLTGDGPRQQRFAGARRAYQQHALRHMRAHVVKALRIAQKINDLLKLGLFLIRARYVRKRDLFLAGKAEMGVGACELRHGGRTAVCAAHKDEENDQQDHAHDDIRQRRAVPRRSRRGKIIVGGQHAAGILVGDQLVEILVEKLRVADAGRDALFCAVFAAEPERQRASLEREGGHLFIAELIEHFGIRYARRSGVQGKYARRQREDQRQRKHQEQRIELFWLLIQGKAPLQARAVSPDRRRASGRRRRADFGNNPHSPDRSRPRTPPEW